MMDIQDRCVHSFPGSIERPLIYDGIQRLHLEVEAIGISGTVWVDGSFTTRKLNPVNLSEELEPGDVDVLTFMDYDQLNSLSPTSQAELLRLANGGETTKAFFRSHTMFVPSCAPGHPYHTTYEQFRRWYRDIFSRHSPPSTRKPADLAAPYPANAPRKGIIEITIGDSAMAPTIERARY